MKYYAIILLGVLIFFSISGLIGKLAFGNGLGDIFYLLTLWGVTIIYLIGFLVNRNRNGELFVISLIFTVPTIWIILMATIWRSSEYSWNGEIFYIPCRTEIKIEGEEREKKEILTMCSMTYYFNFVGTWNGKEMENINGEIKIPQKLKKHLDYPIEKILIEPAYLDRFENGVKTKAYRFNLDTLSINKEYKLGGEICKIVDRKPMIQVRIK